MDRTRPSPGIQADKSSSDSLRVEADEGQQKKRRKRSRNFSRGTAKTIQRTARARQAAWLDGEPREPMWLDGQPYRQETFRLTRELDELYDEHRDEQAGTFTDPFRYDHPGRTV